MRCGWCSRCVRSWAPRRARSFGWLGSWVMARSRCAAGWPKPRLTPGRGRGCRLLRARSSRGCVSRTVSCGGRTRFCSVQRFFSGRSSTAEVDNRVVHRRQPRRVRGRARLCSVAGGPLHVLDCEAPCTVGACASRRTDDAAVVGFVAGQLLRVQVAQAVGRRQTRRARHRPRPPRPPDAPVGDPRRPPDKDGGHHPSGPRRGTAGRSRRA